jgi:hypothetical protein
MATDLFPFLRRPIPQAVYARVTQQETTMPNTPSKGQQGSQKSGNTPHKEMKTTMTDPSKTPGSGSDFGRTSSQSHGNKPQEGHKSAEHRRP